ncbi:hypothetical protein [Streptomyces sp. NPDC054794]
MPVKTRRIAPCRSTFVSSMPPTPASMAEASDITFASGAAPAPLPAPSRRTLADQCRQAAPLGQAHRRGRPAVRKQVQFVKRGERRRGWEDFTSEVLCWSGLVEA